MYMPGQRYPDNQIYRYPGRYPGPAPLDLARGSYEPSPDNKKGKKLQFVH